MQGGKKESKMSDNVFNNLILIDLATKMITKQ